jgi:hypothetical protein
MADCRSATAALKGVLTFTHASASSSCELLWISAARLFRLQTERAYGQRRIVL